MLRFSDTHETMHECEKCAPTLLEYVCLQPPPKHGHVATTQFTCVHIHTSTHIHTFLIHISKIMTSNRRASLAAKVIVTAS